MTQNDDESTGSIEGFLPRLPGQRFNRVRERLATIGTDRVFQPQVVDVVHEFFDTRSRIAADHPMLAVLLGELSQSRIKDGDLILGVVRARTTSPQQRCGRFTGPTLVMVGERHHRVEPETAFVVR